MVRPKAILIATVTILVVAGSAGVWIFVSNKQAAQEHGQEFFGATKEFPTSGGAKMKPEW